MLKNGLKIWKTKNFVETHNNAASDLYIFTTTVITHFLLYHFLPNVKIRLTWIQQNRKWFYYRCRKHLRQFFFAICRLLMLLHLRHLCFWASAWYSVSAECPQTARPQFTVGLLMLTFFSHLREIKKDLNRSESSFKTIEVCKGSKKAPTIADALLWLPQLGSNQWHHD